MCHYVPYVSLGTTALSESTYLIFPHGVLICYSGTEIAQSPPELQKNNGMGSCRSISPRSVKLWFNAADYYEPIKFNFLTWSTGSSVDIAWTCRVWHASGSCNGPSQRSSVSCRVRVDLVRHRYLNRSKLIILAWSLGIIFLSRAGEKSLGTRLARSDPLSHNQNKWQKFSKQFY